MKNLPLTTSNMSNRSVNLLDRYTFSKNPSNASLYAQNSQPDKNNNLSGAVYNNNENRVGFE
jgi:hypothetical protein